jgi:hypothetical protein
MFTTFPRSTLSLSLLLCWHPLHPVRVGRVHGVERTLLVRLTMCTRTCVCVSLCVSTSSLIARQCRWAQSIGLISSAHPLWCSPSTTLHSTFTHADTCACLLLCERRSSHPARWRHHLSRRCMRRRRTADLALKSRPLQKCVLRCVALARSAPFALRSVGSSARAHARTAHACVRVQVHIRKRKRKRTHTHTQRHTHTRSCARIIAMHAHTTRMHTCKNYCASNEEGDPLLCIPHSIRPSHIYLRHVHTGPLSHRSREHSIALTPLLTLVRSDSRNRTHSGSSRTVREFRLAGRASAGVPPSASTLTSLLVQTRAKKR